MADEAPTDVDDEILVLRIAVDQDEVALSALLRRFGPKVKGYLFKQYGNSLKEPEIDEAVNRAFYNVWRFADRFDAKRCHFRGWLIRIAQNAAISIFRGEKRHQAKELDPAYDPANHWCDEPTECDSKNQQRAQELDNIINNELTGLEQAVARADLAAGGPADAERLAALYGTSKGTIYTTRSKVRTKIRKLIQERESSRSRPKDKK